MGARPPGLTTPLSCRACKLHDETTRTPYRANPEITAATRQRQRGGADHVSRRVRAQHSTGLGAAGRQGAGQAHTRGSDSGAGAALRAVPLRHSVSNSRTAVRAGKASHWHRSRGIDSEERDDRFHGWYDHDLGGTKPAASNQPFGDYECGEHWYGALKHERE